MKKAILLLFLLLVFQLVTKAQSSYKIPEDTKRILFLGNSITYAGQYVAYADAALRVLHPDKQYEIINVGLPSETVSGLSEEGHANGQFPRPDLHERLERVLSQTKPDLVFASYGMNDGIYLPFNDDRFQKYRDGIIWQQEQVVKSGAQIIFLTPPVYDQQKGAAYANVLDMYSDWLISQRYTANWQVIDVHGPMRKYQEDKRELDSTFALAADGVHPNAEGHWVMAKALLLGLGEKEVLKTNSIQEFMSAYRNGKEILTLTEQKHQMMKDAWLTATGHTRPGMKQGLPLKEALLKSAQLEKEIEELMK